VLVGIDRTELSPPIPGARTLVGDVMEVSAEELLGELAAFDVVLSDMAPDTTGIRHVDQARSEALFERALDLAEATLAIGGSFVGKLFQGPDFDLRAGQGHQAGQQPDPIDRAVCRRPRLPRTAAMTAELLDVGTHDDPSARKIARAVAILHQGGVAAYPTDSVYALGCAIEAKKAAERIHRARRLGDHQRLALICPDLSAAASYAYFSQVAYRLARRIFPGPYTLVLPATPAVPRGVSDHRKRRVVGIRIPDHPVTAALVQALGRPLLTSSAIPPGEDAQPCTDADAVLAAFGNAIDVVVDGGPTGTEPSTVLAVENDEIVVIRAGIGPVDDLID
jgi:tRNA threonylcarbamoyl adenosine modification protein (Sua5/YciO/YrdC/YwlC family)